MYDFVVRVEGTDKPGSDSLKWCYSTKLFTRVVRWKPCISSLHRSFIPPCLLGPQLLRLPLSLALAVDDESILPPPGLRRVTDIQLLDLIRLNDDNSEIRPRDGVIQVLDLLAELVLCVRLLALGRSSWWGVLP